MLENIISNFIEQQFPEIYREDGQFFVQFMTEYFKWLETDSVSPVYNVRQFLANHDIDTTVDAFILFYKEKYLKDIQINTATNTKQLIKYSTDLYRAKGTEDAIRLFFDLVFASDSEVYYPSTDVFRLSDANWNVPRYLEVTSTPINRLLVGRAITGITSGATAFVEKLVRRSAKNNYVEVLYISAISGDFQTNETIRLSTDVNSNYDFNPKIIGSLNSLEVINGGDDFNKGEEVTLKSITGSEGKALVSELATVTGIVDFSLEDGGWGYTVNSNIYVSDKILQLSNVHVVSTTNTSLADKIINIVQPMANVQWYNNTAMFGVGNTVYNYYANGVQIGVNVILSAEYGTNTTTNYFLLNTISGNNFMDPTAPYYYTAGNTASFQIQNSGWTDETATGIADGISSNVYIYCTGNSSSFTSNDVAYQISSNNQVYANCSVKSIENTGINTFMIKVANLNGMFLTNQPLISQTTQSSANISYLTYDIGIHSVVNSFNTLNGNYIIDTANTSQWNATIVRIPFGAGANTGFDPNLLNTEVVALNTNFLRNHLDETVSTNWINAVSYGANLHFANLTNLELANALMYTTEILGTINDLRFQNPGAMYTYPPFVEPIDPLVAPLCLNDFVIRIDEATGIFQTGEEIRQQVNGAKGLIKFANTSEIHVRRLTFADRWVVGNTDSSYLIIGTGSGQSAYATEVTYDIGKVAGNNAVITTDVTSSNNTVLSLIVTDSGFSFSDGQEVDFTSLDELRSGSALAVVNRPGFGSGYYKTTSGFLSSNKYLYDGYYYQDLSYEIRSPISTERYSDMLKKILHVAGTNIFSAIRKRIVSILPLDSSSQVQVGDVVVPSPKAPVNKQLPLIMGTQAAGYTLTIDEGTWSNKPTSYSYQWFLNGIAISGATLSTYVIQNGDLGNFITTAVTATNGAGSTTVVSGAVTPAASPINTVAPLIIGFTSVGVTVTVNNGTWINTPTSYSYQWKKNGSNIVGEVNNSYTIQSGDIGANILATVTATNLSGSASANSNVIIPSVTQIPVNISAPVISGSLAIGSTLNTTNGTWTNLPTGYSYQWQRNGVNIAGATGSSYTTTNPDSGTNISCVVTATNSYGSASQSSNALVPIAAPVNTVLPVISGTISQGSVLSCTNGTWANSPTSYSYQWQRNGVDIAGATSSTYTLINSDIGANITCTVRAMNAGGSGVAISNSVGPITGTNTGSMDFTSSGQSALIVLLEDI